MLIPFAQAQLCLLSLPLAVLTASPSLAQDGADQTPLTAAVANVAGRVLQMQPSMTEAQIQAAINASAPGDMLHFNAGVYRIPGTPSVGLRLLPGRSYVGSTNGAAVLLGTGGYPVMTFAGSGVVIQNLTFDTGGLDLVGPVTGVKVEYNTFQNIDAVYVNWTTTEAIFIDTSIAGSDISYNHFRNIGKSVLSAFQDRSNAGGIQGYGISSTTINYNTFDNFDEGMHFFFDRLDGRGVKIEHNTFTNGHRIAIELQDSKAGDVEVAYNTISNPLNGWALTYGLSIATNGSTGLSVHDNVINANNPVAPACTGSGCHYGYGIEAAGINTRVFNNVVEGNWANGLAIGISQGLSAVNNIMCGPAMSRNGYIVNELGAQPGTSLQGNVLTPAAVCDGSK